MTLRLVAAYLVAEAAVGILVHRLRKVFPWLITSHDIAPEIPSGLIARHVTKSFDPDLGWCRRPGEHGTDATDSGPAHYSVDDRGRRRNPHFGDQPAQVACFGDSFVFCRLVDDDQTWPCLLSERLGRHVANYGVGNYGFDQALLRLERELPQLEADVVIMGIVPETIARVHSYWKHYYEYGNVLAFKPRFTSTDNGLRLQPSPIRTPDQYGHYRDRLPDIVELDYFYSIKFCRDLLCFPYLPKLIRRGRRHLPIVARLLTGMVGGERRRSGAVRAAFEVVLRDNARWTARLYADADACRLLVELVERFAAVCRAARKQPILLVMPQPADLRRPDRGTAHQGVFARLGSLLPVVDLTDRFRQHSDSSGLFVRGRLGPHCSPTGNALIADALHPIVGTLLAQQQRGHCDARQGS